MRNNRRSKESLELKLDRSQLAWLGLGSLVVIGLSFALGIQAGKRLGREKVHPAVARAPVDPLQKVDQMSAKHDALTFHEVLSAPSDASERRKAVSKTELKPTPRAGKKPGSEKRVAPVQPRTQVPVSEAIARAKRVEADISLAAGGMDAIAHSGQYTVQVSSFQSQEEADAYASTLKRKGYTPFIVRADIPGKGTWYRVRMGAFASADAADRAKLKLAGDAIPAWVLKAD